MRLHQLKVDYDAEQDRLVMLVATSEGAIWKQIDGAPFRRAPAINRPRPTSVSTGSRR